MQTAPRAKLGGGVCVACCAYVPVCACLSSSLVILRLRQIDGDLPYHVNLHTIYPEKVCLYACGSFSTVRGVCVCVCLTTASCTHAIFWRVFCTCISNHTLFGYIAWVCRKGVYVYPCVRDECVRIFAFNTLIITCDMYVCVYCPLYLAAGSHTLYHDSFTRRERHFCFATIRRKRCRRFCWTAALSF